ncbi:MAG: riboflavin synthase, partial [Kordiimonas sp.]
CLTVVDKAEGWFAADVSRETLNVTNLSSWKEGALVNLERSLKLGDELGGHIVTGHVDCVGELVKFAPVDDSIEMMIRIDSNSGGYIAQKGSVTINGVSLTVNAVVDEPESTCFSINIIPHTQEVTSFRNASVGDFVNVEFDVLARYVARLQEKS